MRETGAVANYVLNSAQCHTSGVDGNLDQPPVTRSHDNGCKLNAEFDRSWLKSARNWNLLNALSRFKVKQKHVARLGSNRQHGVITNSLRNGSDPIDGVGDVQGTNATVICVNDAQDVFIFMRYN